jgi:hypothetical protein
MRFFAISTALAFALLAPLAGADTPAPQTYSGSFLLAVPFGTITQNTKVDGIDGFRIQLADGAGPGWQVRAHVESAATPVYDVDVHFYTASGTHVDSQPDLCDTATPQQDQVCVIPDIGAATIMIDAKYGAAFTVTVTLTPPGQF